MIQLRAALIVLLATGLCLLQGGITTVYSEGVSINFSSTSMTGLSATVFGPTPLYTHDSVTPVVTPTPATSIPNSTSAQIVNQNSISSVSISTNSLTSSQQFQQPANMQNNNLFQNPELTSALIRTPNFNPLSEDEPLLPSAESYAVNVCLSVDNLTPSGCFDKKTPEQASEKLAAMILNKYLKNIAVRPFRIVMPSSISPVQQVQLLRKIETEAIALIESTLLDNLKNSKRFSLETDAGKKQMKIIIIQDAQRAREEADNGSNWLYHSKDDRASHEFQTAKAFRQFSNNISIADLINH